MHGDVEIGDVCVTSLIQEDIVRLEISVSPSVFRCPYLAEQPLSRQRIGHTGALFVSNAGSPPLLQSPPHRNGQPPLSSPRRDPDGLQVSILFIPRQSVASGAQ